MAPPAAADGRTLFSVWGRAANDVWACGQDGLVMHFDGSMWTGSRVAPSETLFTVHGTIQGTAATIAVGGVAKSTIVEGGPAGFVAASVPAGSGTLRGVFVRWKREAWATGVGGTVLRRKGRSWRPVTGVPTVSGNDLHSVAVDDTGGVYIAAGGADALDDGALLYFGPRTVPSGVFPQTKLSQTIGPLFAADHGIYRPWSCATAGCHVTLTPSANLNLFTTPHRVWTQLVDVPSTESPLFRVLPGRPSQSYLVHKLDDTQLAVGGSGPQMPQGGPYLSQEDKDTVRAWILEGALDN